MKKVKTRDRYNIAQQFFHNRLRKAATI